MMADRLSTVSTLANYQELLRGERLINDALADLSKAEACGIDCQVFTEAAKHTMNKLAAIKANFFTPAPTV